MPYTKDMMFIDDNHIECERFDGIKIQKVIVVTLLKGEGTEKDPCRLVYVYYDDKGKKLFELDRWKITTS